MKKLFHTLFLMLAVLPLALVSCEDAATGLVYDEMTYPVGNVNWSSDVSAADKAVISQLVDNMVKVEACRFYMGAQSSSVKKANYISGFSSRDTIWYDADRDLGYHVVSRKYQDTVWYDSKLFNFDDTLSNKHGKFPYTLIFKTRSGFKIGPVVTTTMSDYYIGKYEITQAEWNAVMHRHPTGTYCIIDTLSGTSSWYDKIGKGDRVAAYNIWYQDAVDFCETLSAKTGLKFRLPTEAEWECAARGGMYTHGYKFAGADVLDDVAWVSSNARVQGVESENYGIHPVGELLANELGLYDMSGNVSEWVSNGYYAYNNLLNNNPAGKAVLNDGTDTLIVRGGSWMQERLVDFTVSTRKHCIMSSYSSEQSLQSAFVNCGFRVVVSAN